MPEDCPAPPRDGTSPRNSTRNTALIHAPPKAVYRAFTDPAALAAWLVPGELTGAVHQFDLRVGGGYQMSLYYPSADTAGTAGAAPRGKTAEREDRYTARFLALQPPHRLVAAITFDTADPAFAGEMIMEVTLAGAEGGTAVTIAFRDIPPGIRPQDNEAGTQSSLEKLARYLEQENGRTAEP